MRLWFSAMRSRQAPDRAAPPAWAYRGLTGAARWLCRHRHPPAPSPAATGRARRLALYGGAGSMRALVEQQHIAAGRREAAAERRQLRDRPGPRLLRQGLRRNETREMAFRLTQKLPWIAAIRPKPRIDF